MPCMGHLMKVRNNLLIILVFLVFIFATWTTQVAAQAPDAHEAELQAMQQQINALQKQVTALQNQLRNSNSADHAAMSADSDASVASLDQKQAGKTSDAAKELGTGQAEVNKPTAEYQTSSEDQIAAPRLNNDPLDPRYPNYFRLPGTRTFMRIGGYAKSDLIFNPRPPGDPDRFIPASIPIPPPAVVSSSTISVRPSRVNVDFLVPFEKRDLRFFFEMDFFGSNSTTPRLRHAYVQGKNLLVGQTFSNFMDPDAGPDTLDFEGPNSQVNIRNPQVRYTWKMSDGLKASMSVEKPTSDVSFSTPDFAAQPNSPSPDGTFQLRHEASYGHVQFSTVLRDISAFLPDGRSGSVFGWGFNLAGLHKVGRDNLVYEGTYGDGIARYMQDSSGLGIDAAVSSPVNPHLDAVPVVGTYAGYQHYWTEKVRSSVVYGFEQAENTPAQLASAFHQSDYSAVNVIWSPLSALDVGGEFLYGWRVNKDKSSGNAPRVQVSFKYRFMQMMSSK